VDCLNAQPEALHHLGFTGPLAKSTLADANESRDWRIWEGVAKGVIQKARKLYANEELDVDLEHSIYALDSSTVDLKSKKAQPGMVLSYSLQQDPSLDYSVAPGKGY